VCWYQTI